MSSPRSEDHPNYKSVTWDSGVTSLFVENFLTEGLEGQYNHGTCHGLRNVFPHFWRKPLLTLVGELTNLLVPPSFRLVKQDTLFEFYTWSRESGVIWLIWLPIVRRWGTTWLRLSSTTSIRVGTRTRRLNRRFSGSVDRVVCVTRNPFPEVFVVDLSLFREKLGVLRRKENYRVLFWSFSLFY